MSRKTGYIFEKEISDTLKKENVWHFKFVETRTFEFLATRNRAILLPKVPSDFLTIIDRRPVFLECKSTRSKTGFYLPFIKDHQLLSAQSIEDAGGIYLFLICDRSRRGRMRVFCMSQNSLECAQSLNFKLRKTLKWNILEKTCVFMVEKKDGLYPGLTEGLEVFTYQLSNRV